MTNCTIVKYGGYVLEVDVEKTFELNRNIKPTDSRCSCDGCQNFPQAVYYAEPRFLDIMDNLGLDIKRPSELSEFGLLDSQYNYHGIYHIKGKIVEQQYDTLNLIHPNSIQISDKCQISFTNDCDLLPDGFLPPFFQMNVFLILPRVLEYPVINTRLSNVAYEKIKQKTVRLNSKRVIRTLLGRKYMLMFSSDLEEIIIHVDQALYDYFQPGWEGKISYYKKALYSINL